MTIEILSAILFTDEHNLAFDGGEPKMTASDLSSLLSCPLFKGLSGSQLSEITCRHIFSVARYKKHEDIFTPSFYKQSLAVITKGKADVYKTAGDTTLFLSILSEGGIFGMATLFYEDEGFVNTVTAREDCRVCFITKQQLNEILRENPQIAQNYITLLSKKIHYLNSKISNLLSPSPAVRLMSYLESICPDDTDCVKIPISLTELSRVLSLGRTSLYNAIDELTESGRIIREGKTIRLLKPKGNE